LNYLAKSLDLKIDFKENDSPSNYLIEGRTTNILFENKEIGIMGEVHPKILKNWKIKMPVAILEINLEDIIKKLS
jgi:phenylalanyl-tRNA synthetase beta chain